jgi:hypothetical protein
VTCSDGDAAAKDVFVKKIKAAVQQAWNPHLATWVKELAEM